MKPGALGSCYSLLILWLDQFKKTLNVRACFSFFCTVNSWTWSVANRIDSDLQIVFFSISRIGLLVIKLLKFLLTPLSIPGLEQKTHVLMSLGMSLSEVMF